MGQKTANNSTSRLVGSLSAVATSFAIEAPTADSFPIANTPDWLVINDWFRAVIENDLGNIEIVKVGVRTSGSGLFSNVIRAQEGTTALAFDAGSVVRLAFTAGDLQDVITAGEQAVRLTGDQSIDGSKTFLDPIIGNLNGNAATATLAALATNATNAATAGAVSTTVADGAVATTQTAKDATTKVATNAFADRFRSMFDSATAGTLVVGDRGSVVPVAANITVPANVFAKGDVVSLDNTSGSAKSIIPGAGLTLTMAGTTSAITRTLAQNGFATLYFRSATTALIMGGGLS